MDTEEDLGTIQEPESPPGEIPETTPVETEEAPPVDEVVEETAAPTPVTVTLPQGINTIEELIEFRAFQKALTDAKATPATATPPTPPAPLVDETTIRWNIIDKRYQQLAKQYEAENYAKPEVDTAYDKNEALWMEALDDTKDIADIRVDAAIARALAEKQQQATTIQATREQVSTQLASLLPPELAEVAPDLAEGFKGASPAFLADFAALTDEQKGTWITNAAKITLADKVIAAKKAPAPKSPKEDEPTLPPANQRQVGGSAPKPLSDAQKTAYADAITQGYDKARADKIARAIA